MKIPKRQPVGEDYKDRLTIPSASNPENFTRSRATISSAMRASRCVSAKA